MSNSWEFEYRKTRSRTKFKSQALSANLVGEKTTGLESSIWKELAISRSVSLWEKWCGKLGSHKLSLMLKLPVIMKMLNKLTSVSLRYFKADWEESE